ncbi:MAG TPA: DoxX family protein [Myxococcales bacterium]|nr:DoxX family protein [Myxococcales bacterium]
MNQAVDGVIKLLNIAPVAESFARLGYPHDLAVGIGILELACLTLYLIPRTTVVGAVLLTGFLGGAIATHVRVGDPLLSHVLFPSYVGAATTGCARSFRLAFQPTRSRSNLQSRTPRRTDDAIHDAGQVFREIRTSAQGADGRHGEARRGRHEIGPSGSSTRRISVLEE